MRLHLSSNCINFLTAAFATVTCLFNRRKKRDVLTSAEEENGGTKGGFHAVGTVFVWFVEEPGDTRGKSNRPSKGRRGGECWHAAGLDSLHTFEHNPG